LWNVASNSNFVCSFQAQHGNDGLIAKTMMPILNSIGLSLAAGLAAAGEIPAHPRNARSHALPDKVL
jgi:hypothetical protein